MMRVLLIVAAIGAVAALPARAQVVPYAALPSCTDSSGNHLNYNSSTYAFSCGTSIPGALPSGTTATTQSPGDNSTKIATTAYVDGKSIVRVGSLLLSNGSGTTQAGTYNITEYAPFSSSNVSLVWQTTGGSVSFTAALQDNGSNVTGCSSVTMNTATKTTTTCTSGSVTVGHTLSLVLSSVSGTDGTGPSTISVVLQ